MILPTPLKKYWMIKFLALFLFLFTNLFSNAQELLANVVINHSSVQSSDDYIYDNMKKSFLEFLNNRKWTGDKYKLEERIECSFFITINSRNNSLSSKSLIWLIEKSCESWMLFADKELATKSVKCSVKLFPFILAWRLTLINKSFEITILIDF